MNHNVYLPDDVSAKAKAAEINLSGLLREAVIGELERRERMTATLKDPAEYEVDILDNEGNHYVGRITGDLIAEDYPLKVFATSDERVLVYHEEQLAYWQSEDPVNDLKILGPAQYTEALFALGEKPVVDL